MSDDKNNDLDISLDFVPRDYEDRMENAKKTGKRIGAKPRPGTADFLAGETGDFVEEILPYLPTELIGGMLPYVPGTEEEAVWNAASQACATEKVHFVYTVENDLIYYLACPSKVLSSNPDSWCPLSAALPGNSEYWDKESIYLYEQEGMATALIWDNTTGRMQVFLGASRSILPRIQSMEGNFVNIDAESADIVPWSNRHLKTEKLSRATARLLLLSGLSVTLIAALLFLFNFASINAIKRDLSAVKKQTRDTSTELMTQAYEPCAVIRLNTWYVYKICLISLLK